MCRPRPWCLLAVVGICALFVGQVVAQTALSQVYDKNKQVTVKGMLIGSATPSPPYSVYLLISTTDAKGHIV